MKCGGREVREREGLIVEMQDRRAQELAVELKRQHPTCVLLHCIPKASCLQTQAYMLVQLS